MGEGPATAEPWEAIVRFACHILVDEIPNRGLGELKNSLYEMYRFYEHEPIAPVSPVPPLQFAGTISGQSVWPNSGFESDE